MKYLNLTLVHLEEGIKVFFNNESNREVLFFYDENENYIQQTTYPYVDIKAEEINTILKNSKEEILYVEEECFLYYSFNYQVSYAHYLTQCLPKLNFYLNDLSKKLVIPKSTYNNLCKNILSILKIPENNIIVLEDNVRYIFRDIDTIPHVGPQWNSAGGSINLDGIDLYHKLRNALNISPSKDVNRKVYLKRDQTAYVEYNNSEVGKYRYIINEDKLITLLLKNDFEVITLGDKTIEEKVNYLKDIDILITQLGANVCNLIFSNTIRNILVLSNNKPIGQKYYFDMIDMLNLDNKTKDMFTYPCVNYGIDPDNDTNTPFQVDLNDINKYIKQKMK